MTETLKDMMAVRADASPGPDIDIQAVMRDGQRRMWRRRAVGGTTVCAAVAAVALVAPAVMSGSGDGTGIAGSGGFETRKVTYAAGSTIHYGNQEIEVPHEVRSFVQTDDGFVFADADDTVYFTNGQDTEAIGHAGVFTQLFSDDSGSYVAWVEIDDGERPETVVYDTRAGAEVLRTDEGNGPGPGYLQDYDTPRIEGLDAETVYVRNSDGVVAIELSTGGASIVIPPESDDMLSDVAKRQLARSDPAFGTVVNIDPDANAPRFPDLTYGDLSPSAVHMVAGSTKTGRLRVVEVDSGRDVTPTLPSGDWTSMPFWVDDDSFIAYSGKLGRDGVVRSTTCSIASDSCSKPTRVADSRILFPIGYDPYGS